MQEDDTIRRFRYLLGLTDLFRHFIETNPDPKIRDIMAEIDRQNAESSKSKKASGRQGGATSDRRRRTEAEEDAELLKDEKRGGAAETVFRESPSFVHGNMRDYQIAGLNWLISLHENGISGILADEMGLGKTLQTISFLGYLRHIIGITGPHLVTVPKSTLDNWKREFERWTPEVNVLVLQGAKDDRAQLINDRLIDEKFDVCITSYEMVLREKSHLKKFAWEYIIIDEVSCVVLVFKVLHLTGCFRPIESRMKNPRFRKSSDYSPLETDFSLPEPRCRITSTNSGHF